MTGSELLASEFNPYYGAYVRLAGDMPLIDGLESGLEETIRFIESIPNDKLEYRYAEGKWTIKEIVRHIIDTERIFAYRALRFARNDQTGLPGFDQDEYIMPAQANNSTLQSLLNEYRSCRMSSIAMFSNFSDEMLKRIGQASDNPMSARAAGFIIIGHEKHHCNVVRERYS